MSDKKHIGGRLDELADRVEALESQIGAEHGGAAGPEGPQSRYCSVPPEPPRQFDPGVTEDRARAIIATAGKWVNHTTLRYYFFDGGPFAGDETQRAVVREAFDVWKDLGIGLSFLEEENASEAELRIGFLWGDGSWSTVGTGALRRRTAQRTMNFGWRIDVPGPNGLDTAVHEIGHALGFHHEHQNPNAGIVWNREAVYDYFARTQVPPWTRDDTDFNILDKIDPQTVGGSDWDPDSIMHYSFAAGLIRQPEEYRGGLNPAPGLSVQDEEVVKHFYPGGPSVAPQLLPGRSQLLSLAPGEQRDFNILPTETRDYDFRTFGDADTVMVLFQEEDGDFRYVQGDDDSGFDRNAAFRVRLVRGRAYQLRIRLYYSFASGDTAAMMW